MVALVVALAIFALAIATQGDAQVPGPVNDLGALGQGTGQTPTMLPKQHNPEPPLVATPRAKCGPGSKPEPGIQGRVPEGSAANGLTCNTTLIGHQGTSGGFKVYRYVDAQGHDCAYYDTALLFPLNAVNLAGPSLGVTVLDMSDPSKPVQTDTLTEPPMLSPHESLNLNTKRGLLAAVDGNPATYPGLVSIYSVSNDCRHPVLQSTQLLARFGHESGFSPDGMTFYATGTAVQAITAIDVTDPQNPHPIWQGNVLSHGMQLSDDGNRAYVADASGGDMAILDTSQIQARKPNPQVREISRLTWKSASIPQNAIPFTRDGKPYVLEFDEYTAGTLSPSASRDDVGAGRIIDISDETKPRVIAEPAPPDQPARRPRRRHGGRRSGHQQPGPGLRRALLQHPDAGRPEGGRLLVHRVRFARFRHQRPHGAQGDRVLRRAADAALRERVHQQRLRDVAAGVRSRTARDLVHRRRDRLLRGAGRQERLARGRQRAESRQWGVLRAHAIATPAGAQGAVDARGGEADPQLGTGCAAPPCD